MGFLRRLRGGDAPSGAITAWPPFGQSFHGSVRIHVFEPPPNRGTVEVVGESKYQETLRAGGPEVVASFDLPPELGRYHVAVLIPEPDNPYDPNAVRVALVATEPGQAAGLAGYLSRDDAVAWRPVIDKLAAQGLVLGCRGTLRSNLSDNLGLVLHLDLAAAKAEAEL